MDNINKNLIYEQCIEDLIPQQHSSITRYILMTVCIFFTGLIIFSCILTYPITVKGHAEIIRENNRYYALLYLSPESTGEIRSGMQANIYTFNYPESKFGHLKGKVISFIQNKNFENRDIYIVKILLGNELITNYKYKLSGHIKLLGNGEIIIKEQLFIETLIEPINKILNN